MTETSVAGLVHEKLDQAVGILEEEDVGLWLRLVRETMLTRDPALELVFATPFRTLP